MLYRFQSMRLEALPSDADMLVTRQDCVLCIVTILFNIIT